LKIKRGDIFYADLSPVVGSEQDGIRPVLIIQNDIGNKYSPTVIGLAITTKNKTNIPTHIPIKAGNFGLQKDSIILVEQVRTLDKIRLKEKIGSLDNKTMEKVKEALKLSLNIRCDIDDLFKDW
jgi:mRNA interferase MazF